MKVLGRIRQDFRAYTIGSLGLGLILACTGGGPPAMKGTPLLDDFQSICVATGVDPSKIEAAVKATGAKLVDHYSSDEFGRTSTNYWKLSTGGVETSIEAGFGAITASGDQPALIITKCEIDRAEKDPAITAAIRKWLGPAIVKQGECLFSGCDYRESNGRKTPIGGGAEYNAARDAGELMTLGYHHDRDGGHLLLTRSRLAPPTSAEHR